MSNPALSPAPAKKIYVKSLALAHFRNYTSARLEVSAEPVVLIGPNGAGKTNLLEAISLLTPGRGLRKATLGDIDNVHEHLAWGVAAEIENANGSVSIGTGRDPENDTLSDKRIVKIDGKVTRGQQELAKVFSALWLTPQMDTLFIEGGSARRKFLDRLVYSFDSEHVSRINAYEYAMRERNRLLQAGRADPTWLSALEQKMAEQGIAIAVARAHTVEGLTNAIAMARHSFPKAELQLSGFVEEALVKVSALNAENAFKEMLESNRAQDAAAGRALGGIHRTQVGVTHVEKNMPAERCSTGEQKALLVAIILGQARAGFAWHGRVPVLLLDEVVTHLDLTRRNELFSELSELGAQAWLTGTDAESFTGFSAQFRTIKNGQIQA